MTCRKQNIPLLPRFSRLPFSKEDVQYNIYHHSKGQQTRNHSKAHIILRAIVRRKQVCSIDLSQISHRVDQSQSDCANFWLHRSEGGRSV